MKRKPKGMTDEPQDKEQELAEEDLEAEANGLEELPDREVMSLVTPPGDSLGPPPITE